MLDVFLIKLQYFFVSYREDKLNEKQWRDNWSTRILNMYFSKLNEYVFFWKYISMEVHRAHEV